MPERSEIIIIIFGFFVSYCRHHSSLRLLNFYFHTTLPLTFPSPKQITLFLDNSNSRFLLERPTSPSSKSALAALANHAIYQFCTRFHCIYRQADAYLRHYTSDERLRSVGQNRHVHTKEPYLKV